MLSNSKFNKFIQQIPLRDAQRYASAGPVNIKARLLPLLPDPNPRAAVTKI
jgi:hypothetical protein